jgi:hypothetical protein
MIYNYNEWLKNPHKIFCRCGYGGEIIVKSYHKLYGIPEYINGHNMINYICSEKTKQKISKGNINKKRSEQTKQKYSKSKTGKSHPMYGKHYSEERIQKIRENTSGSSNPMYGRCGELNPMYGKKRPDLSERNSIMKGDKSPNWLEGISFEPYCPKFNNPLKESIRIRDGRICQECGKTEQENKRKLTCHHIHYDKPNCNPDLISLCTSCNFKANGNRNYWEEHYMQKLKERNLINIKVK